MEPTVSENRDTSVFYTKPATKRVIVSSLENDFENAGVYKVFQMNVWQNQPF